MTGKGVGGMEAGVVVGFGIRDAEMNASGTYTAKSAYQAQFIGSEYNPMFKLNWTAEAQSKQRFLGWLILHQRTLTTENLLIGQWPCLAFGHNKQRDPKPKYPAKHIRLDDANILCRKQSASKKKHWSANHDLVAYLAPKKCESLPRNSFKCNPNCSPNFGGH
uniref:Reverse transcriptase zinc-binding domain-containing protein n=1 Tax=Oryza punctata TaxID=4537 RepID=A0A0E0JYJ0_ORYPU